jgi:hypothetical protein
MLNEMKVVKHLIEYLQDRADEIVDDEKTWYQQALRFLDDYLIDIQDELEQEYTEKYTPAESYYSF